MQRAPRPSVSILLPVYNAAATVGRAIASIRAQSFADWELLVIDDGSHDESPAVVQAQAAADPRVRLISRPRAGIVAALSAGLDAARGDLVARMDADDESHPERFAAQVRFLRDHPGVGLAGCLVEFGGDRIANAGYALHVDWMNSLVTPEEIARNRFVESPFAHPSVMFRRALVTAHGGYRAGEFPEDYELWLHWLDAGVKMAKVPRALLRWNDPPVRLSRTDPRYDADAFFRVKAPWIARWLAAHERVPASPPSRSVGAKPMAVARPVFVWGAGRPTRKRAGYLAQHGVRIEGYVDVDAKKLTAAIGGTGAPVIAPSQLPAPGTIFVLGYVTSRGARELIRDELGRRGYLEERDFLMCA